jgi:putative aldouronate transport system permease protein
VRSAKAAELTAVRKPNRKNGFSWGTYFKRYWTLYLLLLLPVVFFIVFRYVPMAYILMAFKKNNIIKPPWLVDWAKNGGFEWFIKAFKDQLFIRALGNTIKLNLLDLVCGFPAPILMALVLNELAFKRFKRFTQTVLYLPHFLSWIIISSLALRLFADNDGLINILYKQMTGNKDAVIPFLSKESWWVGTYIGMGIWKEAGWGTIIYLAALTSISPELYEAAAVDGAGRFRRIWHVTLPGLRPTIIVLLIMRLGYILGSEFDRPLALSNKLVTNVSTVISIYVYQKGINGGGQFSLTTAVGLFQSVVGVLFLFGANFLAKRFGERGIM